MLILYMALKVANTNRKRAFVKKEYLYAGVSIFCWSTVATITKLLLTNLNNFQLLWASSFFAFLFLFIVNLFTGKIEKLKEYSIKDLVISALIGLPGTFFYYVFYYFGASQMAASEAFVINYLWPIMSVVCAVIILKEKMNFRKALAILVSFSGIVIIMLGKNDESGSNFIMGAISCVLGAVSYGLFTALNRKYTYDKGISMMNNYAVTFVLTTIINGVMGNLFLPTAIEALGMAWNGMFTMAAANTVWILALQLGKTEKISNLAYITPFLSMVWVSIFLKNETISIYSVLGLIVIVGGILIQLKKTKE